ncbi:hypothetical protein IQ247_06330 [Plectonema cf. radiosum LEGE 06105]|uniref:DUF559 domain-containing protein n=1 Tax=Plectonema cf. radiosum LEGE 06105 TaxID=945769 RepID=A0A8J7F0E1_9CYAN|nr:hypothetical protein [Plectonema radiosum]MBE9212327.1 hypothetical protein [Plectonema cf. radiosum LEGE 06105]
MITALGGDYENSMSYFPIIRIPQDIKQVQSALPPVVIFSEKPPSQPGDEPQRWDFTLIAVETAIAAITVPIISQATSISGWLLLPFAIAAIALQAWLQFNSYPKRLEEHRHQIKDYDRRFLKYEERKNRHEEEQRIARTPERIAQWQYEQILKILAFTISHDGDRSTAPEANAEGRFRTYLQQYFSDKIHVKLTINIPNYEHPYSPDFAYIDRTINLYIDIEIDEPYAYNTEEPTHYTGAWKDNNRNKFFNDKGWIVIRFSERQVICYPHNCCKTVAQIVAQITGDSSVLNQFTDIPDLQQQRQWTEAEAIQMAQRKERDNYQCENNSLNELPRSAVNFATPVDKVSVVSSEDILISSFFYC